MGALGVVGGEQAQHDLLHGQSMFRAGDLILAKRDESNPEQRDQWVEAEVIEPLDNGTCTVRWKDNQQECRKVAVDMRATSDWNWADTIEEKRVFKIRDDLLHDVGLAKAGLDVICDRLDGGCAFVFRLLNWKPPEEGMLFSILKSAVLTISDVSEGVDVRVHTKYPMEREVVLPMCSRLRVCSVSGGRGEEPLRINCAYDGTMLSSRLQKAVWSDMHDASHRLIKVLNSIMGMRKTVLANTVILKKDTGQKSVYTDSVFRAIYDVFEVMDRRGVFAVSYDDYVWAQEALCKNRGFQRIVRQASLSVHFFNSNADLTLHRFFFMCLPGATEQDITRMMRWAAARVRTTRLPSERELSLT